MDAADEAPQPLAHFAVAELRRAAAAAREQRHAKAARVMQRAAGEYQRWHGRHFRGGQLGDERVLFKDLRVAPAARAVELGDDEARGSGCVLDADLEHPVLVAVQCQQRSGAAQAGGLDRIEHRIGGQAGVRGRWWRRTGRRRVAAQRVIVIGHRWMVRRLAARARPLRAVPA
jgi:hypothetical protein